MIAEETTKAFQEVSLLRRKAAVRMLNFSLSLAMQ